MGNRPLLKPDERTSFPVEQFLRFLQYCGLPAEDVDFIHCSGVDAMKILKEGDCKLTCFTGSSKVAEMLAEELRGKIKLEDGGFDWKILGPDVPKDQRMIDYISWQSDQDAYGHSG